MAFFSAFSSNRGIVFKEGRNRRLLLPCLVPEKILWPLQLCVKAFTTCKALFPDSKLIKVNFTQTFLLLLWWLLEIPCSTLYSEIGILHLIHLMANVPLCGQISISYQKYYFNNVNYHIYYF